MNHTTSAYLACRSNRLASCGSACWSAQASRATNGIKPCCSPSSADARIQPDAEKPTITGASTPNWQKVWASLVPWKADGYFFVTIRSFACGSSVPVNAPKGEPRSNTLNKGVLRKNTPPSTPPFVSEIGQDHCTTCPAGTLCRPCSNYDRRRDRLAIYRHVGACETPFVLFH